MISAIRMLYFNSLEEKNLDHCTFLCKNCYGNQKNDAVDALANEIKISKKCYAYLLYSGIFIALEFAMWVFWNVDPTLQSISYILFYGINTGKWILMTI